MAIVISADSHVTEVPATWERVQKRYGDKAPKVVWNPTEGADGPHLIIEGFQFRRPKWKNGDPCASSYIGMVIGGLGLGPRLGRTPERAAEFQKNFRFEDWKAGWEPEARLKAQEKDGVTAEILYSSHLRRLYEISEKDEPFFRAIADSYNEWLMEFCSHDPKRLIGLPVLSVLDVNGAVEDLQTYAQRGAKGFMIASSIPIGMSYGDPMYDPLWAAAQDAAVPLSLHSVPDQWKAVHLHHPGADQLLGGYGEVLTSLCEMIYGGVFDRFPRLKIVSAEFDIGWVAHAVGRGKVLVPELGLKMAPADYFQQNIWFTFQDDRAGCLTTPMFGADRFLWSNDFPHGVTTWPDSQVFIDRQFEGIPEDIKEKVIRENASKLYNLAL